MLRRRPSRNLIASAVLLACLTLTGQPHAQAERTGTIAPLARANATLFGRDFTTLLARAHGILIAKSARGSRSLLSLPHAAVAIAFAGHVPTLTATEACLHQPSLCTNAFWMRTSRAWAS